MNRHLLALVAVLAFVFALGCNKGGDAPAPATQAAKAVEKAPAPKTEAPEAAKAPCACDKKPGDGPCACGKPKGECDCHKEGADVCDCPYDEPAKAAPVAKPAPHAGCPHAAAAAAKAAAEEPSGCGGCPHAAAAAAEGGGGCPHAAATPPGKASVAVVEHRGAEFTRAAPIELGALIADAKKYEGKTVTLRGDVMALCPKTGNWFVLAAGEGKHLKVTTAPAFQTPTKVKGWAAKVEGTVSIVEVSEEMLKAHGADHEIPKTFPAITATAVDFIQQ